MTSVTFPQHPGDDVQPWPDWTNLTLGVFLAASPWLALGGDPAVMWNAVVCGTIVAIATALALSKPRAGAEWINLVIGLWLLMAPWTLGFSDNVAATWTSVGVGLGVTCLARAQLSFLNRLQAE